MPISKTIGGRFCINLPRDEWEYSDLLKAMYWESLSKWSLAP